MYIKLLDSKVNFANNSIDNIIIPDDGTDEPGGNPSLPDVEPSVPEVMPEQYANFISTYTRSTMNDEQRVAAYTFLYKLNDKGLMSKIRQLYMPCLMPDWDHCFLNVASYFNKSKEEYTKFDLYSNSTLGRCFEVCDYGLYKTTDQIQWGDCLTSNWTDEDVTFNNWHIFMFKPAQQDASTGVHSGGLNLRSRDAAQTVTAFAITGAGSATQRVRAGWGSGTVTIDGTRVPLKNGLFTEPIGWGNGTHDPFCAGISINADKMLTPSSIYQEFVYNNRNLVNEISEWPLTGDYALPTTPMTGTYGWGGYCGASISTQQSLATSIVSIGLGLSKDEIQEYMDIANEFMVGMGIDNPNWNPDNLN